MRIWWIIFFPLFIFLQTLIKFINLVNFIQGINTRIQDIVNHERHVLSPSFCRKYIVLHGLNRLAIRDFQPY